MSEEDLTGEAWDWLRSALTGLVTGKGDARIFVPEKHIAALRAIATGATLVAAFDPADEYENGVRLVAPTGQVVCRACFHRVEMFVTDDGRGHVWGVSDGGATDLRPKAKKP